MEPQELAKILAAHKKWLDKEPGGVCAYFRGADLRGIYLGHTNLGERADLRGANFRGVNLENTSLAHANLGNANLEHANLGNADLGYTKLEGTNLGGADIRGTYLGNANLRNADLRGIVIDEYTYLENVQPTEYNQAIKIWADSKMDLGLGEYLWKMFGEK